MKLQLNDEKTRVDPWSHIDTFEGWTVLTETIVGGGQNWVKFGPPSC